VGALDQLRSASGDDGLVGRARSNPWLLVAIVGGAILILAWIGWAIHVSSDAGARAALGVLIAWPAMLAALALISLPFIGGYLLIRRVSASGGETMATAPEVSDEGEEEDEGEDTDEAGERSDEEEDAEEDPEEGAAPEAAAS
jgi:hypothetical protein